jgi:hypothetical protein
VRPATQTIHGCEGTIHLAVIIGENAKVSDFVDHEAHVRILITFGDTQQNQQAVLNASYDGAVDCHRSPGDTLKDRFHGVESTSLQLGQRSFKRQQPSLHRKSSGESSK